MATQIQIRRDTVANWASINPILAEGELGLEKDTGKIKIGDGLNPWQSLSYNNGGGTWGSIIGTLTNQTDLITALNGKVATNAGITGATKTKITYDAKGLVTAGADATTADIAAAANRNYLTDAQLAVIQNTSGLNTGDQTLAGLGGVPNSRKVNGHTLSADVTVTASDVGLGNVTNDVQLKRSANDFSGFAQKNTPAATDVLLIEDSAASGAKKYITVGSLPSGGSGTGPDTVNGTAGEALLAYNLCYLKSDGKYWKAGAGALATMPGIVLANSAFGAGQAGSFIRRGQVVNSNWSWGTIGGFVYADITSGALTQTLPSQSGNQVQIVGIALSATQIDFDPQLVLVEVP